MKTLIIVDMQEDFIRGPLGTPEAQKVEMDIARVLRSVSYDHIFVTRDTHDSDYLATQEGMKLPVPHCIKNTPGWQVSAIIMAELKKPEVFCTFINKPTFGYLAWNRTSISGREDDEIILVGVCTDVCVISNALILRSMFPYARIRVVPFLCAGTSPENHQKALDVMKSCQIEVG